MKLYQYLFKQKCQQSFGSRSSNIQVLFVFLVLIYCWFSQYRYGRKPVFFTTMAVQMIFTFAQIFSPSWIVFTILFFFAGLGQIANYVSAFVLGKCKRLLMELLAKHLLSLYLPDLSYKLLMCSCAAVQEQRPWLVMCGSCSHRWARVWVFPLAT